jgi:hypothetical protein
MSTEDLITFIKQCAVDILNRLNKTSVESPESWPGILRQYEVLAKQYAILQEAFAKITNNYAVHPKVSPNTTDSFLKTIPQLLGTKVDPDMEQEEKLLVKNSGLLQDDKIEDTLTELNKKRANFNKLCDDLLAYFNELRDRTQVQTIPDSAATYRPQSILEDRSNILLAFAAAVSEGQGVKNPPPAAAVASPSVGSQQSVVSLSALVPSPSGIFSQSSNPAVVPAQVTSSFYTSPSTTPLVTGQSLQIPVAATSTQPPVPFVPSVSNTNVIKKPVQTMQQLNLPIRNFQVPIPPNGKQPSGTVVQNTITGQLQQQPQAQPLQQTQAPPSIVTNVTGTQLPFGTQSTVPQPQSSVVLTNLGPIRTLMSSHTPIRSVVSMPTTTNTPTAAFRGQPISQSSVFQSTQTNLGASQQPAVISNVKFPSQSITIPTTVGTLFPTQSQQQLQLQPQHQQQQQSQLHLQP